MLRAFLFIGFLTLGCSRPIDKLQSAPSCPLFSNPQILLRKGEPDKRGSVLLQVWEVSKQPLFWTDAKPDSISFGRFRDKVTQLLPSADSVSLLRKIAGENPTTADEKNAQLAIDRSKEWIHPIRCLEASLMTEQTDRMDMVTNPTEFTAFILRSPAEEKLRIYFYTANFAGIGRVDAPLKYVREDIAKGWQLWANLHNHNFFVGQQPMGGGVAPSHQDVGLFRALAESDGLEEAWITNGFDTIRLEQKDFLELYSEEQRKAFSAKPKP